VALPIVRDQSVSALPKAYDMGAEAGGHIVDNKQNCDQSLSGQAQSMNVGRALLTGGAVETNHPHWQLSLRLSWKR
jgi:hypothetical protein